MLFMTSVKIIELQDENGCSLNDCIVKNIFSGIAHFENGGYVINKILIFGERKIHE